MKTVSYFKCPVCGNDLSKDEKSFFCTGERRHLFDISSEGYVNLLPPGRLRNARAGDDRSMIAARASFLDLGYYKKISEKAGELISEIAENQKMQEIVLADCACGEGYHTCNIISALVENNGADVAALAFDASKYGAAKGAKRARKAGLAECLQFAAANIFTLPVKDGAIDFATSIFAPVAWDEMQRILKDDGRLIVASSGERHLFELRVALYDAPRTASGVVNHPDSFVLEDESEISYTVSLADNKAVCDLFCMTPFYYRTSERDREKLGAVSRLDVTVETKFSVYRKKI